MSTKLDPEFVRAILKKDPLSLIDMKALISEVERLEGQVAEKELEIENMKTELDEQCKINGMGAQRELQLMTTVTEKDAEIAKLREALNGIKQEIVRGKSIDCIGCCNGNDIPEEQLCRMCWRIWVNKKMYLLWDYKTTEARIQSILGEKEGEK